MENEKGRWITTKTGTHVFIKEGQTVSQALEEKFDSEEMSLTSYDITRDFKDRSNNMTQDQEDFLYNLNDNLPKETEKIFEKLKDKDFKVSISDRKGNSKYNRSYRTIYLDLEDLKEFDEDMSIYINGQVLYHEIGHAVDNLFCNDKWEYMSSTYKSKLNGLTLHDTILKERRKFSEKIISDIAFGVYADFIDKELELLGSEKEKKWKAIKRISDKELGIDINDYDDDDDYWKARRQKRNEKFKELFPDEDYTSYERKRSKAIITGKNKFLHEYNVLSDIASSKWFESVAYGSKNAGFGVGHSETYYQDRKGFGLGTEFFANCFSAVCTNHNEVIEATAKYFPQSIEVFKEILEEIKK